MVIPVILAFIIVVVSLFLLHFMTMKLDNSMGASSGNRISQISVQQVLSSGVVCPLHYLMFDETTVQKNP
jgi:hypothetical protein